MSPCFLAELAQALMLRGEQWMAMLWAYVDDSGTHDDSRVVIAGCYVSTLDQWCRFTVEWQDMLDTHGLSSFRATDCVGGFNQFGGWSKERRDAVMRRASSIASLRHRFGVGAGFPLAELKAINPLMDDSHPFTVCSMEVLRAVRRWMRLYHPDEEVAYIFEDGSKGAGQITMLVNAIRRNADLQAVYRLAPHSFAGKTVLALQAADLLAYECGKEGVNRLIPGTPLRPRRKSLETLIKYRTTEFLWSDRKALLRWRKDLRALYEAAGMDLGPVVEGEEND